jgi:hypothetical protein
VSDYRFAGVERGRALRGSRAIAEYLLGDPEATDIVLALDRVEWGLVLLGRDVTGYSGWIDHALVERARTSKGRRRTQSQLGDADTTV